MMRPTVLGFTELESLSIIVNKAAAKMIKFPRTSNLTCSHTEAMIEGNVHEILVSTSFSECKVNLFSSPKALIVLTPFRVSPKCEYMGDIVTETNLFSCLEVATYTFMQLCILIGTSVRDLIFPFH